MTDASSDPKALWRDQDRDSDPMTLDQIHALVRRYDARARRVAITIAVMLLAVGAFGMLGWVRSHDPVMATLFVGGELTACFLAYRHAFPPRDPAEPAAAYLRRRLQLRLAHLQGGWVWVLLPILPCVLWTAYLLSQRHGAPLAPRVAPFVLFVLLVGLTALQTRRRAAQVEAELKELDSLMGR